MIIKKQISIVNKAGNKIPDENVTTSEKVAILTKINQFLKKNPIYKNLNITIKKDASSKALFASFSYKKRNFLDLSNTEIFTTNLADVGQRYKKYKKDQLGIINLLAQTGNAHFPQILPLTLHEYIFVGLTDEQDAEGPQLVSSAESKNNNSQNQSNSVFILIKINTIDSATTIEIGQRNKFKRNHHNKITNYPQFNPNKPILKISISKSEIKISEHQEPIRIGHQVPKQTQCCSVS